MENKIHPELKKLLDVLGFRIVSDFNGIRELFDITTLDKDNTPKIVTTKKTVIVFDNSDFNSTYIIDMVNDALDGNKNLNGDNYDFVYVDNPYLRRDIFHPELKKDLDDNKMYSDIIYLETNILRAGIIVINPVKNHIVSFMETHMEILNQNTINGAVNWLWSENPDITVIGK